MTSPANGGPSPDDSSYRATIRLRVSAADAHYAGGLTPGAWILKIFGDLATELCLFHDRDEGLLRAYENLEFLAPVHTGDFIEAHGRLTLFGRTSRRVECEAWRVAELDPTRSKTAGRVLEQPVLVARAHGTVVVPTMPATVAEDHEAAPLPDSGAG